EEESSEEESSEEETCKEESNEEESDEEESNEEGGNEEEEIGSQPLLQLTRAGRTQKKGSRSMDGGPFLLRFPCPVWICSASVSGRPLLGGILHTSHLTARPFLTASFSFVDSSKRDKLTDTWRNIDD
ncbi:MAG: hypothetical protein ACWGSD_01290, partial [Thermodesulfobacteriota bacterium]